MNYIHEVFGGERENVENVQSRKVKESEKNKIKFMDPSPDPDPHQNVVFSSLTHTASSTKFCGNVFCSFLRNLAYKQTDRGETLGRGGGVQL